MLVGKRADIESRCAKRNTPLMLASGAGLLEHVRFLIQSGADPAVTNARGLGCLQAAEQCSSSTASVLSDANAPATSVRRERQWNYKSIQRVLREALAACDKKAKVAKVAKVAKAPKAKDVANADDLAKASKRSQGWQ